MRGRLSRKNTLLEVVIFPSGSGPSSGDVSLLSLSSRQDYLVSHQLRPDNPVSRGHYVPGKAFGGHRERALLPSYHKLPWLPSDEEWLAVLGVLKMEKR